MPATRKRARPLSPDERRAKIIAAARPLFYEHGHATSTRLVAEAAGIAEGTIFRVFATKEELVDAVLDAEFDPQQFLDEVAGIDLGLSLEERLVAVTTVLQRRFLKIFHLMAALGLPKPPPRFQHPDQRRRFAEDGVIRVVSPDADRFRVPPDEVVRLIRLLTFSGSHPHISDGKTLTPPEIVSVVLHGTLKEES